MNQTLLNRRDVLVSLAAAGALVALPRLSQAAPPLPGDSVYQMRASLVDQDGHALELDAMRGTPVLVSMFYSSCDMVCPMIFETIHAVLAAVPVSERKAVRVLMVSFDPARDSVAVLKKTADQRNCDSQWTLARCDEATARKVAAVLGIQYRRLTNGEFNHSTLVTLLDRDGRVAAKSAKLGGADAVLVKGVHKLAAA
ncbi:SCO family protein [Caenimonas koreensis DSM 17982]|uniref:SCO family protein n=1 Tax=Caenimonas koreensis DSM 17982 TaxID=1121255 RepID=A0A844BC22_9BURK|nr:SCO family protein [Caenimonas koreensis]MRD48997.1 SCO family protein [Caenimonas koreensis DSM 17982]